MEKPATTALQPPDAPSARRVVVTPRLGGWLAWIALLALAFAGSLRDLFVRAWGSDLDSHILLVPAISAWLLHLSWRDLPKSLSSSPLWAAAFAAAGIGTLFIPGSDSGEVLAWRIISFLLWFVAGGFLFAGRSWMKAAAFPFGFLVFLVPMPDRVATGLEDLLTAGSVEVADWFFRLSGTPVYREGPVLQIPGISLEVARECSGIRSTLVLFITSVLASRLILRSPWRRAALVAAVLPLGLLRNGLRILVIGLLCVHEGSHMIDSVIHRKGGPLFFAVSLLPLFFLAWWLRRGESPIQQPSPAGSAAGDPLRSIRGARLPRPDHRL